MLSCSTTDESHQLPPYQFVVSRCISLVFLFSLFPSFSRIRLPLILFSSSAAPSLAISVELSHYLPPRRSCPWTFFFFNESADSLAVAIGKMHRKNIDYGVSTITVTRRQLLQGKENEKWWRYDKGSDFTRIEIFGGKNLNLRAREKNATTNLPRPNFTVGP